MKSAIASLNDVPEAFRTEYELKDGKYVLKIEGTLEGFVAAGELAQANGKLTEFRDNNVKILKALGVDNIDAALQRAAAVAGIDPAKLAKLKDIDPEEYAALKAKVGKMKEKGVDDPDQLDAKITAAVQAAIKPMAEQLTASQEELKKERERADDSTFRTAITERFVKAGGKAKLADYVIQKAREDFRVEGGVVKAQANKFSSEKPGEPLGIDEWLVTKAAGEFDFAFEANKGGGATGGQGNGSGGSGNPAPVKGTFKSSSGAEIKTEGITVLQ